MSLPWTLNTDAQKVITMSDNEYATNINMQRLKKKKKQTQGKIKMHLAMIIYTTNKTKFMFEFQAIQERRIMLTGQNI